MCVCVRERRKDGGQEDEEERRSQALGQQVRM